MAHKKAPTEGIRVRYAPSPTGPWHVGGARTALFNWLFARKNSGVFIVRVEDTDKERSKKEYETAMFEALAWLGIDHDEGPENGGRGEYGPYRQSERTDIYARYIDDVLESGLAYHCYCTHEELETERAARAAEGLPPKYGGRCRDLAKPVSGREPQTIRFRTPEAPVTFTDMVRGSVTFDAGLFGDMVIAKSRTEPLYNFAVVIDDELMNITHVIRGEDHISNTPKQILFQRALGFSTPQYAHIPLLLDEHRAKLSKRTAETSVLHYRDRGYLPEAFFNFLALLGWHPKEGSEILAKEEIISAFDLGAVQKGGAVFAEQKLQWMNREYLRKLPASEIASRALPLLEHKDADATHTEKIVEALRDRLTVLTDIETHGQFFFSRPAYEPALLIWKDDVPAKTISALQAAQEALELLREDEFTKDALAKSLSKPTDMHGKGSVLWPLRVALSGLRSSPDPFSIAAVLGKEETLARIGVALTMLAHQK